MKKNTLLIIFVTLLIISLGGLTLFFGYKYFTVDNKCEYDTPTKEENKEVKNMTDSEILRYISTKTHNFEVLNASLMSCKVKSDILSLNGVLSSQNEAKNFNHKIMDYTMVLRRGNLLSIKTECQRNGGKEECNDCEYNITSEYAVVNGIVTVIIKYHLQNEQIETPVYLFYDIKNDKTLKMGDAMRLMGVTDLGGAKNYEDLNKHCSDLTITNHNKVIVSNYREQCA